MWVSRRDWNDLQERVKKLEKAAQVETEDKFSEFVWPGYSVTHARKIDAGEAISLLAQHIGVRFRWHDAKKTEAYGSLEKKAKLTLAALKRRVPRGTERRRK